MNSTNENRSKKELVPNLIAIGLAGSAMGLLLSIGFGNTITLGVIAGALFGVAIGYRVTKQPPRMRFPLVMFRRIAYAAAVFLLLSAAYSYLIDLDLTRPQVILVSLMPAVGWAFVVIAAGMAIASLDELQRRIQTEAISIAFAGTMIIVAGYALLQFAGFAEINVGVVIFIMSAMLFIGKLWTIWRYR